MLDMTSKTPEACAMNVFSRVFVIAGLSLWLIPTVAHAKTLSESLAGRILLQVQSHGEAWYVDPVTHQRFYLGRAEDAYALMRAKGLGIRHAELARYLTGRFPLRLSGRIVLDVETHGEAYYVSPLTLQGAYLGTAADAYALMRRVGLGISTKDLSSIPVAAGQIDPSVPVLPVQTPVVSPYKTLEQDAFNRINAYRQSKGLSALTWNDEIAKIARQHSVEMANGTVAFGHAGFSDRAKVLQAIMPLHGLAENVAYNDYPDPAYTSVNGWIESDGHRANIENPVYALSGMGVSKSSDGAYYFTQLFVTP